MKWTKVSILTYTSYKADTVFHGSVSLNSAPIVLFLARFTSAILVLLLFLGYAKHPSKLGAFKISVPFIWNVFPQNDIWLSSSFYSLLLKCHLIRWHRLTLLAPWPALVFYIGIITTWQSIFNYLFVHHIYTGYISECRQRFCSILHSITIIWNTAKYTVRTPSVFIEWLID